MQLPHTPCTHKAVKLKPDWPEAHITLARVQLNFGEPLLALHSYQAAARLQPEHPDLVSHRSGHSLDGVSTVTHEHVVLWCCKGHVQR